MIDSELANEWTAVKTADARTAGIKEGRTEGIKEGRTEGQALMLLDIMESKYGAIPLDLTDRIRRSTDITALKRWSKVVLSANSLADFRRETQL